MQQYPKCRTCGHSKTKHVPLFNYPGFCRDCWTIVLEGPQYEWEIDMNLTKINMYHKYTPDNLTYIEKLAERRKLI